MCHIKICAEQNKIDVLISYFALCIILSYSKHWFHFEVNRKSMVRPNLNDPGRDEKQTHPYCVFL